MPHAKKYHPDWYIAIPEGLDVWVTELEDGTKLFSSREEAISEKYTSLADLVYVWQSIHAEPTQGTQDTGVNNTSDKAGSEVPESTATNKAKSGDGDSK